MNKNICPKCQASIQTAKSALEVIGAEGASDISRRIAASELTRSIRILCNSLEVEIIAGEVE